VIAYAIFGVCMGWGPWNVWRGFTRPMITVYVLGLISLDDVPARSVRAIARISRRVSPAER
jgi:hypothetical protein